MMGKEKDVKDIKTSASVRNNIFTKHYYYFAFEKKA